MKKLIALILCMLIAVVPVAMAEGYNLTIGNMHMTADGTEFALNGIDLVLSAGQSDAGAGLRIAVNANGSSVADLNLQITEDKLIAFADGISDIYSIDLQTVIDALNQLLAMYNINLEQLPQLLAEGFTKLAAEWSESIEKITAVVAGSITADGTVEIDGETAAHYVISISEDGMQTIIDEICARLGSLMIMIGQTDAAEEIAYIADSGVHFSLEGSIASGETKMAAELRLIARDEETGETANMLITENGNYTEENGMGVARIEATGALETENGMETIMTETMEAYTINGEFAGFDFRIAAEDGNPIVVKLDMPAKQAEGMMEFSITFDDAAQTEFNVKLSDAMLRVAFGDSDSILALTATKLRENAVNLAFDMDIDGNQVTASMDATIAENDASWLLPTADETVDVLTMDQEQQQKLLGEVAVKATGLLGTLAGSSQEIAALVAGAM